MAEDYYATLGVDRKASSEEIQKAYRQLARKYHPDLNPGDETAKKKFHEVQTAFEVLNDQKKRELYDRYGNAYESVGAGGPGGGGGPQYWSTSGGWGGAASHEVNLDDLFGGGGAGGFADFFKHFGQRGARQQRRAAPTRGANLEHSLTVPFTTAVLGGEAQLAVRRSDGKVENIHVKIPAGIEDGKKIRLRGQGEPSPHGGPAGDILIKVTAAPHPYFRRSGKRLDVKVPITLTEAVAGGKIDVPTPHGTITLTIPPGTSSGTRFRVKGHGVKGGYETPGDLFAEVEIHLPENLSDADRQQIAEITRKYQDAPRKTLRW